MHQQLLQTVSTQATYTARTYVPTARSDCLQANRFAVSSSTKMVCSKCANGCTCGDNCQCSEDCSCAGCKSGTAPKATSGTCPHCKLTVLALRPLMHSFLFAYCFMPVVRATTADALPLRYPETWQTIVDLHCRCPNFMCLQRGQGVRL